MDDESSRDILQLPSQRPSPKTPTLIRRSLIERRAFDRKKLPSVC